jgi:simple sugar transport system permease protein
VNGIELLTLVIGSMFWLSVAATLAGIGELILERAGGFNVAIEGMMLVSAAAGVVGSHFGGFAVGLLSGIAASVVVALILGYSTAYLRADQAIVGIALAAVTIGLSVFLFKVLAPNGSVNITVETQPVLNADWLRAIPVVGNGLSNAGLLFWISVAAVVLVWWLLGWTRFGLRLRTVGDDPTTARTRGISTRRYLLAAAALSGVFVGLAGAAVPLASIGSFSPGMTGGIGYIALGLVAIARWRPFWLLLASLAFAFFSSLALVAQTTGLGHPLEAYQALPYAATLVALCITAIRTDLIAQTLKRLRGPDPTAHTRTQQGITHA